MGTSPDCHHLRLFGPPALYDRSGQAVALRTRKQMGVLVVLALEGRGHGVSRDAVVEYFWPDVEVKKGRHSLAQALTAIRGALGQSAVVSDGPVIRFEGNLTSDADTPFRCGQNGKPTTARPSPLLEMETLGGVELSHWVDRARTRILRGARDALTRQIESLRVAGRHQRSMSGQNNCTALIPAITPPCT